MSDDAADDRRSADGADAGADDAALVGAGAPAGSARASARAAAARSGVTAGKGRATASRDGNRDSRNIFQRLVRYIREVVAELRKVIWPTKNEMVTYSIVVLTFLVFMVAAIWALDMGFTRTMLSIFG